MIPVATHLLKHDAQAIHEKDFAVMKKGIAKHGQSKPILINTGGTILDGVLRYEACRDLGVSVLCEDNEHTHTYLRRSPEITNPNTGVPSVMNDSKIIWAPRKVYDKGYPDQYIIAAAITYEGIMFLGMRHAHCLRAASEHFGGIPIRENGDGFCDNHMHFLSREEAYDLAVNNGQIKRTTGGKGTLYSEDLW